MKRLVLGVMLMSFLAWILGCGQGNARFVSEEDFQANLAKQTAMSPQTLTELRKHDVTEETELKLEFFFYTDSGDKASALSEVFAGLDYSVEHGPSASDEKLFLITGWTTKMPMSESRVVAWTRQMCELGFEQDCDFDGWGTNPTQE